MIVSIKICWKGRWHEVRSWAPDGSDEECYALPRGADRIRFWSRKIAQPLPQGHAMIWQTVKQ